MLNLDSVVDIDNEGFLVNPEYWSHAIAKQYAKDLSIGTLDKQRWIFMNYLLDY